MLQFMNPIKSVLVAICALLALSGQTIALATICPMESMAMSMETMGNMEMQIGSEAYPMSSHDMSPVTDAAGPSMDSPTVMDCQCSQICSYCLSCLSIPQNADGFANQFEESVLLGDLPQASLTSPPDSPFRPPIVA